MIVEMSVILQYPPVLNPDPGMQVITNVTVKQP
jgi:hypothetical protein